MRQRYDLWFLQSFYLEAWFMKAGKRYNAWRLCVVSIVGILGTIATLGIYHFLWQGFLVWKYLKAHFILLDTFSFISLIVYTEICMISFINDNHLHLYKNKYIARHTYRCLYKQKRGPFKYYIWKLLCNSQLHAECSI